MDEKENQTNVVRVDIKIKVLFIKVNKKRDQTNSRIHPN